MCGGGSEVKETAYEKELAKVAQKELAAYKEDIIPFRNKWIDDVTRDTGALEDMVSGQVNADVAQKRATALPAGVDPTSGMASSKKSALAVGNVGAKASLDAGQAVRDSQADGLQAAINVMRGENVDAQAGMQGLASDSVNEAISDASNDANVGNNTASAIMTGAGAAAAFGGEYFKNQTPGKTIADDLAVNWNPDYSSNSGSLIG